MYVHMYKGRLPAYLQCRFTWHVYDVHVHTCTDTLESCSVHAQTESEARSYSCNGGNETMYAFYSTHYIYTFLQQDPARAARQAARCSHIQTIRPLRLKLPHTKP